MYYNTFLFTRDKERDYGWRKRPAEFSDEVYRFSLKIIELLKCYPNFTIDDWKKLFFVYKVDNSGFIARIIPAGEMDVFGRPIFTFEGVCFEGINKRRIVDIPSVIDFIQKKNMLFREEFYLGGKHGLDDKIYIDSAIDYFNLKDDSQGIIYKTLVSTLLKGKAGDGIVYGPKADIICLPGVWVKYDSEKMNYSSNVNVMGHDLTVDELSNESGSSMLQVMIKFGRLEKSTQYSWHVIEKESRKAWMTSATYNMGKGVSIERLMREEAMIRDYLTLIGKNLRDDG